MSWKKYNGFSRYCVEKITKLSFLFFCFIVLFLLQKSVHAQDKSIQKDSIDYFYNLLRSAKKSDDYLKVHRFYSRRKEKSYLEKDTLAMIYNLRFLASVERKLGQLEDSEVTAVIALELISKLIDGEVRDESKMGVLNHLGIVSRELEQYDRALEFYKEALKIAANPVQKSSLNHNIGRIYKLQGRYDLAIPIFTKVYEQKLMQEDVLSIARSLDNLGYSHCKDGNFEVGLSNMLQALKIRINEDYLDGITTSYLNLAECYIDFGKDDLALDYVNKAYVFADFRNEVNDKIRCLSYIIDLN